MDLTIRNRIMILDILPPQGNYITMKVIRGIEEKIGFTGDEITNSNIRFEDKVVRWSLDKEINRAFDFTEAETKIIVNGFKNLDQAERLTKDHITVYELFL